MVSNGKKALPSPLLVMNLLSLSAGPSLPLGKLITHWSWPYSVNSQTLMRQSGRCWGYSEFMGDPPAHEGKISWGVGSLQAHAGSLLGHIFQPTNKAADRRVNAAQ